MEPDFFGNSSFSSFVEEYPKWFKKVVFDIFKTFLTGVNQSES